MRCRAELVKCEGKPDEMHALQEEHRREEQRLAHVVSTWFGPLCICCQIEQHLAAQRCSTG